MWFILLSKLDEYFNLFLSWKDILEILFISTSLYTICLWLSHDRTKKLLYYFYAYCFFIIVGITLDLPTINILIPIISPVIALLFLIFHQDVFQKNFIGQYSKKIGASKSSDWPKQIIRICLHALSKKQSLNWIIEHNDPIKTLLSIPLEFEAPLSDSLLHILLESSSLQQNTFFAANTQGFLLGMNAQWAPHLHDHLVQKATTKQENILHEALFFADKTDACILITEPSGTFSLIARGKTFQNISAHNAVYYLRKYAKTTPNLSSNKDFFYETLQYNNKQKQS